MVTNFPKADERNIILNVYIYHHQAKKNPFLKFPWFIIIAKWKLINIEPNQIALAAVPRYACHWWYIKCITGVYIFSLGVVSGGVKGANINALSLTGGYFFCGTTAGRGIVYSGCCCSNCVRSQFGYGKWDLINKIAIREYDCRCW